ncbi:CCA tRNA nucleotidyltransferase [Paenibacillus sp. GP183]|uniref:CCA tRNA nucleotidyltransferase n=1 Tax=Paenibacillus sp. GP183 TaxID=1882751 RepID=UPI000B85F894|nr:CCA tRNA nucleotidyltransferase [Paenibacillus sp. GP183]
MEHEEAGFILDKLQDQGFEAYLVGGCVRDYLLKRPIQDVDIATSALPEQVMALFTRTAPTGLQHGTVTVILEQGAYEVTTFRTESQYEDYRRPKEVAFVSSLKEDLRRRDFTMNAMALDRSGTLIDPFGGQKDLQTGLLRCVGEAEQRFGEDALRMLRCIRFASTYALQVEAKTWQALLRQAPLLRHVAMERVRSELQRMVAGAAPARAVQLLLASRLWRHFKKQLPLPFESWLARPEALDAVSALQEQNARWALLLLLLETPADMVRSALQELTFSRADTDAVTGILALHEQLARQLLTLGAAGSAPYEDPLQLARIWKLAAVRHGVPTARAWLQVLRALQPALARDAAASSAEPVLASLEASQPALARDAAASSAEPVLASLEASLRTFVPPLVQSGEKWLEELSCTQLKQLSITGSDLVLALDRPAGPWIGLVLQELLECTALNELHNDRESLLLAARQWGASHP